MLGRKSKKSRAFRLYFCRQSFWKNLAEYKKYAAGLKTDRPARRPSRFNVFSAGLCSCVAVPVASRAPAANPARTQQPQEPMPE